MLPDPAAPAMQSASKRTRFASLTSLLTYCQYAASKLKKSGSDCQLSVQLQAVGTAVEAALAGALPFVGALVSVAFMRHAYHSVAKWVGIVACQRHEAWLMAHWHQLSQKPDNNASSMLSAGSSTDLASRDDVLSRHSSAALSSTPLLLGMGDSSADTSVKDCKTGRDAVLLVDACHADSQRATSCAIPQAAIQKPSSSLSRGLHRAGGHAELLLAVSASGRSDSAESSASSNEDSQLEAPGFASTRARPLSKAGGPAELLSALSAASSDDSTKEQRPDEDSTHARESLLRRAGGRVELLSAFTAHSLADSA